MPTSEYHIAGVIGAGSFGTAVANLLAQNTEVLVYSRKPEVVAAINEQHHHYGVAMHPRVRATTDLAQVAAECHLIFPIVPSTNFRRMMRNLGPHLRPYHLLIHGTKGFDVKGLSEDEIPEKGISRNNVYTMSEVIQDESCVVRVGCLSGPNLASELLAGQPTATLIASRFDEVISAGKSALNSKGFHIFGSHDLLGAELAGALKNTIAIGSGILKGMGLGKNIQAMLITRGLTEMVHFGNVLGAESVAFFGTAGIGDLVATATSSDSRNFTFGYRLGKGESMSEIVASMPELAEGVRTIRITRFLARHFKLRAPITEMLYLVVFEGMSTQRALDFLISYPYDVDVDFM